MSWMHHQSVKAQHLLQRKRDILYMYRRLLPVRGLTFVYPASLVRDWSRITDRNFRDVGIRWSTVQRLVNRGPNVGSRPYQGLIDCHFQQLQSRLWHWAANGEIEAFLLRPGEVGEIFQMGAVFASLVEQHYAMPVYLRRNCAIRRCLVTNRWLV